MIDILIVGLIAAAVALAIKKMRKDKKSGAGCAGCSGCSGGAQTCDKDGSPADSHLHG